jgi:hypothetical protein
MSAQWLASTAFLLAVSVQGAVASPPCRYDTGDIRKCHMAKPSHRDAMRDFTLHVRRTGGSYADFTPDNPPPGAAGWVYLRASGWVFFGPGYTFLPHKGIINEACNLPTSACPNSERDVN